MAFKYPPRMPKAAVKSQSKLRSYWTGLKTTSLAPQELAALRRAYRTGAWEIRFVPDRAWLPPKRKGLRREFASRSIESRALQIRARSLGTAFYVADLLYAARSIIEAPPVERVIGGWDPFLPVPEDKEEMASLAPDVQSELAHRRSSFHMDTTGLADAAEVACALSRRVHLRNAAFKFLLSGYLFSVHHMELRPGARAASEFRPMRPVHAIWFAQALFAAYGVVEELRVAPNASSARPSLLPDGNWNPPVRGDLEQRLRQIGIGENERLYWHVRGRARSIEQRGALKRIATSPRGRWSRGETRDVELLFIDAINIASYLRSNQAAHVGGGADLTAIDVANVQQLARHLLLRAVRFHFWRYHRAPVHRPRLMHRQQRTA